MKTPLAMMLLVALGGATALFWWRSGTSSDSPAAGPALDPASAPRTDPGSGSAVGVVPFDPPADAPAEKSPSSDGSAPGPNTPDPRGAATKSNGDAPVVWPVVRQGDASPVDAAAKGEPAVTKELAFRALALVGVDPEAEKTWLRAIDDPNLPDGVRSDLIEDLNQEGYTDNSHPTKADLPLILARLELIERLAPLAKDEVNASAFEEAYKDLLEMYVRLGGEPRDKR